MSYHIYERWPFTSLQNMNLDWLLTAMKEAVTTAEDTADTVSGFDDRITEATTKANLAQQESFTAQTTAVNAQSAAAAAQDTADLANLRAATAQSAAAAAQDTADLANLRAATAQSTATNALDDYLDVKIVLSSSIPAEADKNVDDIMTAYAAGKKIRFYLQDVRNSTILVSYDFKIIPTAGSTDTHILVLFDDSLSSSTYNAIVADFAKTSGTYSLSVMDIAFAGGGGGGAANAVLYVAQTLTAQQQAQARDNIGAAGVQIVWGYQDEDDQNRSVIRRKSDNSIYTPAQMLTDQSAGSLVLVESPHGIFYLSAAGSMIASFFNGGTYTMVVSNDGQYSEIAMPTGGAVPVITNTNTNVQLSLSPNTFYIFPNASQLSISFTAGTAGVVNEYHFRFTSGSTATQLDLPATVEIPDDFDVAVNTVYEVSIIDNYMVYSSWAVSA